MQPQRDVCTSMLRKTPARPRRLRQASPLCALLLCALPAHAQSEGGVPSAPANGAFQGWDVISVKPNKSSNGNMGINTGDGSFRAENCDMNNLLLNAYGIHMHIVGVPAWANGKHWDINAKVVHPDPAPKDRKQSRAEAEANFEAGVQAILKERFHLKAHTETRTAPIFDLVVAKGGAKLKKADPSEAGHGGASWSNNSLEGTAVPLSDFADMITAQAGHPVVDKTGISGDYDIKLRWTNEDQAIASTDSGATDRPPSFPTALEEQLGLKLVPSKGPVTTLVIDSLEMPAED